MNSKITKLTIAAVIVIAAIISFSQFGNDINIATPSYASVLEEISKTKDVIFTQIMNDSSQSKHFASRHGLHRSDYGDNFYFIKDYFNGREIRVDHQNKRVCLVQTIGKPASNRCYDFLSWIRDLHEKQGKYVGQEQFEGRIVDVFVAQSDPYEKYTLWVDPATNLPLQVKEENFPNTEKDIVFPIMTLSSEVFSNTPADNLKIITRTSCIGSKRGSGEGISEKFTRLMKDFQWNVELDMSLFSFDIPSDYSIVDELEVIDFESDEKLLAEVLTFWAETNDGQFPVDIDDLGDPNIVKPLLKKAYDKDGDAKAEFDTAYNQMDKILTALYFVQQKKVSGSWAYTGSDIEFGDTDSVIYWFKHDDSEEYTIIYGDLTIEKTTRQPVNN
ncbi:MAG TPA: hypothetical protein PLP05_07040 [Sedimentisphaerales bacterium]|nr:hypothetical protein [Sedimentisphaerales bacterium]